MVHTVARQRTPMQGLLLAGLVLLVCVAMCAAQTHGCVQKHRIVSDDTCWAVAQKYGLSLTKLYAINANIGLSESKCWNLRIGNHLCVRVGDAGTATGGSTGGTDGMTGGTVRGLPISSGTTATLTVFDDRYVQCFTPAQASRINLGVAVNPLMLGITKADWKAKYVHAQPSAIPWCGKTIEISFNGRTQRATIVDTCQPCTTEEGCGEAPACNSRYDNIIDFWANGRTNGESLLRNWAGDDFYQGNVKWRIL